MGLLLMVVGAAIAFLAVKLMDWTAISVDRLTWMLIVGLAISLYGCAMMGGEIDPMWLLMCGD